MQIIADVGGIPGKDCRGYCKYCYFRKVKDFDALGCKFCFPGKIGCDKCTLEVSESKNEFFPPFFVLSNVQNTLMMSNVRDKDLKINLSGGGDLSCYPHLLELTSSLYQMGTPIHLGYTSGKGIDDSDIAIDLIKNGVEEVTFTVFSTDPLLRKKWMKDENPQESLKALKTFSENVEVHAASVIIPGVNDGEKLYETCSQLEEWGAKAFILMRFANYENQGLILGNEPILKGIKPNSIVEFEEMVRQIDKDFNLRITGTPVCDPKNDAPFAISLNKNKIFLQFIPEIKAEATILTSKVAAPYIKKIIKNLEAEDLVTVYPVEKDIGCLITKKDLEEVNLKEIKETVIFPGRAFVHDQDAQKILSRDGVDRIVARGPDKLTVDGEMSGTLTDEDIIERELEAFRDLVGAINFFGVRK